MATSLPAELIVCVANLLDRRDQAALASTTRFFHHVLNPLIYTNDITIDNASCLFWAAEHGQLGTLEHALKHGAQLDLLKWPNGYPIPTQGEDAGDEGVRSDGEQPEQKEAHVSYTALAVAARYGQCHVIDWLINHGASVNASSCGYCECRFPLSNNQRVQSNKPVPLWRPLHTALCYGQRKAAELLINRDADIHNVSANADTRVPALHFAAANGLISIIKLLSLDFDLDINERDKCDDTALHYASLFWPENAKDSFGDFPIHKLLSLGADLEAFNSTGFTPLLHACYTGNWQAAMIFLNAGAASEPHSIQDFKDVRPLYYCVRPMHMFSNTIMQDKPIWERDQLKLLRALINAGADVNGRFSTSNHAQMFTPLMYAARNGVLRAVEVLCEAGAIVNAPDNGQRTALEILCLKKDLAIELKAEIVTVLLKYGARLDILDFTSNSGRRYSNYTAMEWAVEELVDKRSSLLLLVAACAEERNVSSDRLAKAITFCAQKGNAEALTALLRLQGRLYTHPFANATELISCATTAELMAERQPMMKLILEAYKGFESMETLLWRALQGRNLPLALLAIEGGVAVSNVRLWGGTTYLHLACSWGELAVVDALLERGAEVNTFDSEDRTPLSLTVIEDHPTIAAALMREVADPHLLPPENTVTGLTIDDSTRRHAQGTFLTAFDLAVQLGRKDILLDMLSRFALPDIPARSRITYVHRACWNFHHDMFEILFEKGAHPDAGRACYDPPLNNLLRHVRENPDPADMALRLLAPADLLLENGANVHLKDSHGETAYEILKSIENCDDSNPHLQALRSLVKEIMWTVIPGDESRLRKLRRSRVVRKLLPRFSKRQQGEIEINSMEAGIGQWHTRVGRIIAMPTG